MTAKLLRIAIATTEHIADKPDGGLANYTDRISFSLREAGHYVDVFAVSNKYRIIEESNGKGASYLVPMRSNFFFRKLGKLCNKLKLDYTSDVDNLLKGLAIRTQLRTNHKSEPYDIVHYSNLEGLGFFRLRVPSIVRLSSYHELWESNGQPKEPPLRHYLEDIALKKADMICAPSYWVANHVQRRFKKSVTVIESPLPQLNVKPEESTALIPQKPFGLFFGSLSVHKGIHQLLRAIEIFFLEEDFHFVIAGPTWYPDPKIDQQILDIQKAFPGRLHVLPTQTKQSVYELVAKSSFVALPSLAENLSNAALEAMSLGAIVIGTQGRSFEQLIDDGKSGFLCEPGSTESLLNSFRKAVSLSAAERQLMSCNARKRVALNTPDLITPQLVNFYQEAIALRMRTR